MKKTKLLNNSEITEVLDSLAGDYPDAKCALDYDTRFHLAVAVILSAQTTDVSVNRITPALFDTYPDAFALAAADSGDVEDKIRSIGLFRNKAKNIIAMSKAVAEQYGGEIPGDFDELVKLPGVGRKTANVILSEAFGEQRIAVDTHVFRVANRIGITDEKDVLNTERELMRRLPRDRWTEGHHLFIFHGRRCCKARNPLCDECSIRDICRSNKEG